MVEEWGSGGFSEGGRGEAFFEHEKCEKGGDEAEEDQAGERGDVRAGEPGFGEQAGGAEGTGESGAGVAIAVGVGDGEEGLD